MRQRGQEVAALHRDLIEPARRQVALRALPSRSRSPNSRIVSSGVKIGSSARVTPSRLNSAFASSVISAGSRSPLRNERSIKSIQHASRLHLGGGELVVARDRASRSRACTDAIEVVGGSPISISVGGDVVAAMIAERHQQARRRARACVGDSRAVIPKSISASRTSTSSGSGAADGTAPRPRCARSASTPLARARVDRSPRHLALASAGSACPAARRTRCPGADRRERIRRS